MSVLNWRTPIGVMNELLLRKRPNAANLIVSGAIAYVTNYRVPIGHKVDSTALIGYLVGYEVSNLWRVWIPELKSHQS